MNPLGAVTAPAANPQPTRVPGMEAPASGFEGLFALFGGFGPTQAEPQSEPTALPLQALAGQDDDAQTPLPADPAATPALPEPQPDPVLLAALGLTPLPSEPRSGSAESADAAVADATRAPKPLNPLPNRVLPSVTASVPGTSPQSQPTANADAAPDLRAVTGPLGGAPAAQALAHAEPEHAASDPVLRQAAAAAHTPGPSTLQAQPPRAGADFSANDQATTARAPAPAQAVAQAVQTAIPQPASNARAPAQRALAGVETSAPVGFERPEGLFREAFAQQAAQAAQAALQPRMEPGSSQFGAQLGQQLLWMGQQKIGRAEIRLDPAELGPLTIELEMDGDEIRAEFSSRSAEVRALIDSQVPRLRELLAEQGFSLADAQVGQGRADERGGQQAANAGAGAGAGAGAEETTAEPIAAPVRARLGLVDDYA